MLWKLIAPLVIVAAMVLLAPGIVSAHAELDSSLPGSDATVDQVPAQVELWFTEELAEGSTATITGPDGARVDNGDAAIDLFDPERKHLAVTLMPDLPSGEYTVTWTSVSGEDNDTDAGSFTFTVSPSGTPVPSPATAPAASPSAAASPEPTEEATAVTQTSTETATPDVRALMIALAAGVGAAVLIYGFWLKVKPRV